VEQLMFSVKHVWKNQFEIVKVDLTRGELV